MLSLINILHQLFQPYSIAKEAGKALTDAIYHIKMDDVFKDHYVIFVYSLLTDIEPDENRQVYDLPKLWSQVDGLIDRDELFRSFSKECKELDLPFMEYDIATACIKAQNEWAEDFMVATADWMLKANEDEIIRTQAAFWDNGHIRVDTTACKNYRDWLIDNDLSNLVNNITIK